ncbi:hypothetical protein GPX89_41645 [Nocardia sp. ET3-3]|uniref:Uncharacterized protein n=1 Tax=Nocardia terrae TaxID=2675851 RepID=A0A7K1VAX9_9NOCA|nr:hypothetical protein [Nocardia terrae]MVU83727.1 hypothetical protein [Nocardia terrae]
MLTVTMNDRAATLLRASAGFDRLDPPGGLAEGLRAWADRGIARRGEVIGWAPVPATADHAPGDFVDLTGWECAHTYLHLEDFVPDDIIARDGSSLTVATQRELLRHGIALTRELAALAATPTPPIALRCIISANETNGTFRFHEIRPGESWHTPDLDNYDSDAVVVIDFTASQPK